MNLFQKLKKLKEDKLDKNKAAGVDFMKKNAEKPDVLTHQFGFQYIIHSEGEGSLQPYHSSTVTCHYKGSTIDGTEFDSSYKRNKPATFPLNQVIKGWQLGLPLMKKGARYTFIFPPELAYGDDQVGGVIGPGSTLIFDIELIDFS